MWIVMIRHKKMFHPILVSRRLQGNSTSEKPCLKPKNEKEKGIVLY